MTIRQSAARFQSCQAVVGRTPRAARLNVRAIAEPPVAPRKGRSMGETVRNDFPILKRTVHGDKPLVYLDSGATSQKPQVVLDCLNNFYAHLNSHVVAPVHALSAETYEAYHGARQKVARLVNAADTREIVFTRNATEGVNIVASTWALENLKEGDEVVLSVMEMVAKRTGCKLRFIRLTADERLDMHHAHEIVSPRTKLISITHVSNTLGCVNPVEEIVELAQKVGAKVMLDACQSVPHMNVDVQALGVDWIVASSHKMCGPDGIGFLWGKLEVLESMPPFMGGGEMIQKVTLDNFTYLPPPTRFEAGTPAMGEAIALGEACDYLMNLGLDNIHAYEQQLGDYLYQELSKVPDIRILGPPPSAAHGGRAALCAFHHTRGAHASDISKLMDQAGVAIRSGTHCTQPLHHALGLDISARASLYLYNTMEEVDIFVSGLESTLKMLKQ